MTTVYDYAIIFVLVLLVVSQAMFIYSVNGQDVSLSPGGQNISATLYLAISMALALCVVILFLIKMVQEPHRRRR